MSTTPTAAEAEHDAAMLAEQEQEGPYCYSCDGLVAPDAISCPCGVFLRLRPRQRPRRAHPAGHPFRRAARGRPAGRPMTARLHTLPTTPNLGELLAAQAARRRDDVAAYRTARAELVILERFNEHRARLGYDYGGGQRAAELSRRRNELERLERNLVSFHGQDPEELADPTEAELRRAYRRQITPRLRRAARDRERFIGGRGVGPDRVIRAGAALTAELMLRRTVV